MRRSTAQVGLELALLVGSNLVPLGGVLFLGWNVYSILVLYWLENGVIGVVNVLKITRAEGGGSPGLQLRGVASTISKAAIVPFFVLHYGIFWVVHGVFVVMLPILGALFGSGFPGQARPTQPAAFPAAETILLGVVSLAVWHVAAFYFDYLGRRRYRVTSPVTQMLEPYPRLIVLHVTILLGAFVVIGLGQPILLVALLVGLKTLFDLFVHLRTLRRTRAPDSRDNTFVLR